MILSERDFPITSMSTEYMRTQTYIMFNISQYEKNKHTNHVPSRTFSTDCMNFSNA